MKTLWPAANKNFRKTLFTEYGLTKTNSQPWSKEFTSEDHNVNMILRSKGLKLKKVKKNTFRKCIRQSKNGYFSEFQPGSNLEFSPDRTTSVAVCAFLAKSSKNFYLNLLNTHILWITQFVRKISFVKID